MHLQSNRQLQDRATTLPVADVLAAATRFFVRASGVYSAFVEKQGPTHLVLRGQGGEEIVIAARAIPGGSHVTGSTYLFDQQVARFLDSLPPAPIADAAAVEPAEVTPNSGPAPAAP